MIALSAGWTASAGAATVIAIALSASAGSALLAPRSDPTPMPAAILAVLFALFGTAALLSTFLLRWVQTLYLLLWPLVGGTAVGTWGLRLLLALTLLALPAAIVACVPPVFARLIISRPEGAGLGLGFALGLSLAGIGLGVAIAGSLLLPGFG